MSEGGNRFRLTLKRTHLLWVVRDSEDPQPTETGHAPSAAHEDSSGAATAAPSRLTFNPFAHLGALLGKIKKPPEGGKDPTGKLF